jgi:hypothetical protein
MPKNWLIRVTFQFLLRSFLSVTAIRGGTAMERKGDGPTAHELDVEIRSILTFLVRTLAGVAFLENGRNAVKSLGTSDPFVLSLR